MQWAAALNSTSEVQVLIHICSNKIFLKENCEDWKRQFIFGKMFPLKRSFQWILPDLSIVTITILLLLQLIHQFKRIIKKKMKKRSDLHY